jgi:chromosome segregation ATPase
LRAAVEEYEAGKNDYFIPQLELRRAEIQRLSEEIERQRAAADEQERLKTEWFAPQLELRAAEIEGLSEDIERLRTAADEYERVKTEWFAPQLELRAAKIERLTEEIARLRIKLATGEASFQAERRRVLFYSEDSSQAHLRIAELEDELAHVWRELQNLKSSHSYALMQLYIRLHDSRVLGWPVRLAKRLALWRLRIRRFAA